MPADGAFWPNFATHNYATGVSSGHNSAAGVQDLRVCFLEITAEVVTAKSEVLKSSLHYQEIFAKPTLKMR